MIQHITSKSLSVLLVPLLAFAFLLGTASASEASHVRGSDLVPTAQAAIGTPYVFGANGPSALDCSALVRQVLAQHGITNVPRTSINQHRWTRSISRSQLRAGDLVFHSFSARNGRNGTDHVSIYIGNGQVIDASRSNGGVVQRRLIEHSITGYGRIPGVTPGSSAASSPSSTSTRSVASSTTTRAEAARIVADRLDLRDRRNPFGVTTEGGAVGAVYHAGIGLPYSDGTWRPHARITQGQLAAWLDRADASRADAARIVADVMGFDDRRNPFGVTTRGGAVGALYQAGIALPYADGTWRPHTTVTRGQLDAWMRRGTDRF
jgi:hypothetical protein